MTKVQARSGPTALARLALAGDCHGVNVPRGTAATARDTEDGAAPPAGEDVLRLMHAVRRAMRERFAEQARGSGAGAHDAYLPLLALIAEHPGVTLNELARLAALPKSRVSVLIGRLVDQGAVRRDADRNDRRLVRLTVTAHGRRCAHTWADERHRVLAGALESLSGSDLARVIDGLETLLAAVERHATGPVRPPAAAERPPC